MTHEASTRIEKKKTSSSVQDVNASKPPFGSRFLTEQDDVWSQNAWDHVPPPEDQADMIASSLQKQKLAPVPSEEKVRYNDKPSRHWDNFYKNNASNFFRDRKWLHNEFPELVAATQAEAGPMAITEIGCGAGNSVFPLLAQNQNHELTLRAYDYSSHAVKLIQTNPLYTAPPAGSIYASVWDLTSLDGLPRGLSPGSIDIVILVFVLSALHPDEWRRAIINVHTMLKPGGIVLFRDYGRYDLTQLRFKTGRLLDENFYIRGDKTRVYFFDLDELALLFTGSAVPPGHQSVMARIQPLNDNATEQEDALSTTKATEPELSQDEQSELSNLATRIHPNLLTPFPEGVSQQPLFNTEKLGIDRRLLVNRKRQLKMYRVWMQGKFKKI